MAFFIPVLLGVSATAGAGWWWSSSSSEDDKPTVSGEIWETVKPIVVLLLVVVFLRWLWKKGSTEGSTKNKGST